MVAALQERGGSDWLRGVGYHELVAGELDRWLLDEIVADRPLKIQHRSGKMWMLNSLAAERLSTTFRFDSTGEALDSRGQEGPASPTTEAQA